MPTSLWMSVPDALSYSWPQTLRCLSPCMQRGGLWEVAGLPVLHIQRSDVTKPTVPLPSAFENSECLCGRGTSSCFSASNRRLCLRMQHAITCQLRLCKSKIVLWGSSGCSPFPTASCTCGITDKQLKAGRWERAVGWVSDALITGVFFFGTASLGMTSH